ncbi:hypothetical protein PFISCL1PPCAC_9098, partial [Pristionchus fissidentatus]
RLPDSTHYFNYSIHNIGCSFSSANMDTPSTPSPIVRRSISASNRALHFRALPNDFQPAFRHSILHLHTFAHFQYDNIRSHSTLQPLLLPHPHPSSTRKITAPLVLRSAQSHFLIHHDKSLDRPCGVACLGSAGALFYSVLLNRLCAQSIPVDG